MPILLEAHAVFGAALLVLGAVGGLLQVSVVGDGVLALFVNSDMNAIERLLKDLVDKVGAHHHRRGLLLYPKNRLEALQLSGDKRVVVVAPLCAGVSLFS